MNKGIQMKPNNSTKAKKDLSEYPGLVDKLPKEINQSDVGYYHLCLITARDNKSKTKKNYDLNLAKLSIRSYEDSKEIVTRQYSVVTILHDPTKDEAKQLAQKLHEQSKGQNKINSMGANEYAATILNLQSKLEAMEKALKGKEAKTKPTPDPEK